MPVVDQDSDIDQVAEFRPADDLRPGMVVLSATGERAMVRGIGASFDGRTRTVRLELLTGSTEHVVLDRADDVETLWRHRDGRRMPASFQEREWRAAQAARVGGRPPDAT